MGAWEVGGGGDGEGAPGAAGGGGAKTVCPSRGGRQGRRRGRGHLVTGVLGLCAAAGRMGALLDDTAGSGALSTRLPF